MFLRFQKALNQNSVSMEGATPKFTYGDGYGEGSFQQQNVWLMSFDFSERVRATRSLFFVLRSNASAVRLVLYKPALR